MISRLYNKLWLICLCVGITLNLSCETDSPRVVESRTKISTLEKSVKAIHSEMEEVWQRSLKYRFADVQRITSDEITLNLSKQGFEYFKSIRIQKKGDNKVKLFCNYRTKNKNVSPEFVIYFFDNYGINVHRQEVSYGKGWLGGKKKLKLDKLTLHKLDIEFISNQTPYFFLIGK